MPVMGFAKAGGYRVLACLANEWSKMGHEVVFISHYETEPPYFPIETQVLYIDENGIEKPRQSIIHNNGFCVFRRLKAIFFFLKKNTPFDCVIANHCLTAFPIAFASKSKRNFYYIQAYEPDFFKIRKSFKGWILTFLAWLTYFLPLNRVVNSHVYQRYKNIKSERVIYPGIHLEIFYPKEATIKNWDTENLTIGCIGRLNNIKGTDYVGEAIRILHQKGYPVKLKVAFHPVKYEKHELVFPHGDKNLADYYRSLDILVAPMCYCKGAAHYPVIEAMACNTSVISAGHFPANDKNAFIVPNKSPEAIAETILYMLNNPELVLRKSSIALSDVQKLSWVKISAEFIRIIESI